MIMPNLNGVKLNGISTTNNSIITIRWLKWHRCLNILTLFHTRLQNNNCHIKVKIKVNLKPLNKNQKKLSMKK